MAKPILVVQRRIFDCDDDVALRQIRFVDLGDRHLLAGLVLGDLDGAEHGSLDRYAALAECRRDGWVGAVQGAAQAMMICLRMIT
jgi:hypothetical protein